MEQLDLLKIPYDEVFPAPARRRRSAAGKKTPPRRTRKRAAKAAAGETAASGPELGNVPAEMVLRTLDMQIAALRCVLQCGMTCGLLPLDSALRLLAGNRVQ